MVRLKSTGPYHHDKVKTGALKKTVAKIIKISESHNKNQL